jgi:uncharacterized cupredoxin-like copper-binding protein
MDSTEPNGNHRLGDDESGGSMTIRYSRILALAVAATSAALLAAVPALASAKKTVATTVNVTVNKSNDFKFVLSKSTVTHGAVTFKFSNKGSLTHDFKLCSSNKGGTGTSCVGKVTPMVAPGKTATLKVTLTKPGKYEYLCTVPGHAAGGMKGLITVK